MRAGFDFLHISPKFTPLVFSAGSLMLGLACGSLLHSSLLAIVALSFSTAGAVISLRANLPRLTTIALLAGFVTAGISLSAIEGQAISGGRLRALFESATIGSDSPAEVEGWLAEEPEPGPNVAVLTIEAERLQYERRKFQASGLLEARVRLNSPEEAGQFESLHLRAGSRVRFLAVLRRSSEFLNPGVADYTEYLDRRGRDLTATIKSSRLIENLGSRRVSLLTAGLGRLKSRLQSAIDQSLDSKTSAIVKAVALGNRNYLDDQTSQRFQAGGAFHLLVIAGIHLAFLVWVLFLLMRPLARFHRFRFGLVVGLLWLYAGMVGLHPPVTRATLMITIALFGQLVFREARAMNSLALAALLLLALKPSNLLDPSFQLSFAAVAIIVALPGPIYSRLRAIGTWVPGPAAPYPPNAPRVVRYFAEALFWSQRTFEGEQANSPIKFRLEKANAAVWLERLWLQRAVRWVAVAVITSTLVQLGLVPFMSSYFNRVPLAGIVLNVFMSIVLALLLTASVIAVAGHALWAGLVPWGAHAARFLREILTASVNPFLGTVLTERVPHLSGRWAAFYLLYYCVFAVLVAALARWNPLCLPEKTMPGPTRLRAVLTWPVRHAVAAALLVLGVLLVLFFRTPRFDKPQANHLRISFLDVGQGDSALIEFPGGATMLVDGGGRPGVEPSDADADVERARLRIGERVVSRFLWQKGIRQIDYLVATHGDADHVQGLNDVVRNFRIGRAITGPPPADDPEIEEFAVALAARHVAHDVCARGSQIQIGSVNVEVLWPPVPDHPHRQSTNNDSVVLLLRYGEVRVLLTGDIEKTAEKALVAASPDLRADVLKVPHHGSKTSSTEEFLERVQAQYAIISAGQHSPFGHPNAEVLDRLHCLVPHVQRTGCSGTITIDTDGSHLQVSSYTHVAGCLE